VLIRNSVVQTYLFLYDSCTYFTTKEPDHASDKGRIYCNSMAFSCVNPLKPNDPYRGRTAPLTSKRCILYIYSTNIGTECFKRGIHSPFFLSSKCSLFYNSSVFGSCIIHILYTGVLKLKKIIPTPKVNTAWVYMHIQRPFAVIKILFLCEI